ncbi:TetR/AcrR family transcriptional regulator [Pseudomonas corrugata]|uniref:TetR/AcrR family transcriptional regulator n=1 Tax=Pseudomonas corrugata TaxID=47879 RepID=UPI0006D88DF0|nr:TetR/AcrR family transcriptional regulator [Pseudomonas corrugata]
MPDSLDNFGFRDLRLERSDSLKPRERILKTAVALFNERGVHTIGIDKIIAESGVSKRTFYNYFASKSDLIAAYLDFGHWHRFSGLREYILPCNGDAKAELVAIFDFLEHWFSEEDFRGCAFARGLNDFSDQESKNLREKVMLHFDAWATFIRNRLTTFLPADRVERVLPQFLALITGATVVAHASGNAGIAQLNKSIAIQLLA